MKILLDVNTPRRVRGFLSDHDVSTAQEQGWHTIENGELLRAAETAGFEVIVTCDKNMKERRVALIVLSTNDWSVVRHSGDLVTEAVNAAKPNSYCSVDLPVPRPLRTSPKRHR